MRLSMLHRKRFLACALLAPLLFLSAQAAPPPIEAFARIPAIRNVAVSPDAKQVLYIGSTGDFEVVLTASSSFDATPKAIFASKPG